jgi:hypothetical protein
MNEYQSNTFSTLVSVVRLGPVSFEVEYPSDFFATPNSGDRSLRYVLEENGKSMLTDDGRNIHSYQEYLQVY